MHFPSIEGTFSVITFTRSFWGKKKVVFVVEEEVMGRLAGGGEGGEVGEILRCWSKGPNIQL